MREALYFYLAACPHCKYADKVMTEVKQNPKYANVEIKEIEESLNEDFASKFDYNYVPTFFIDGVKVFEAQPGSEFEKEDCIKLFDKILGK